MKKIISILLIACMLFSMLTTVMAEQTEADKLDAFEYKDISISDASRQTGINSSGIGCCCKYLQKTAGGFIWRYKDDESNQ